MAKKMTISDHSSSQPSAHTQPVPKYKSNEKQTEELPDGGLQAWATVAGGFMLYVAGLGYFNAYGVYQDFYVRQFMTRYSPAEIAWIGSCQIAIQFVLGLPVGKLFDAGYFHHLMIVGSIIYCFSLWALSLAKPNQYYLIFLTQGVGMGIGLGLTFLPALAVTAHHFSRRRGLAMGIMTSGASIGGIIFPIMLNNLLFRHGFAIGVRATAALITALMLLANLLIRPRYRKNQPASKASLRIIINDLPYMIFVAAGVFIMLGIFYPIFYLQLYAIKQGIREKIAFDTITLINAGGVLGRVIPNFLADRVGSFNVIIPVIFLAAGCVLAMLAVALGSGGIIAVSLLYGIMNAGFVSISPALLAELSTDRSEIGIRMGLWFSFTAAAAMAGQPLSGALILGNFRWSTVFAGVCLCVGGSLSILSRLFFLRRRLRDGGAAL
ncbi:major facilitator superfamily domain-containing protein [Mycena metata]|uniref:Major facilitator superfamily domain-containing protein n=1 Tax=Mycena metata TaxID=1033252 RepID=A0AAD7MES4_9AGAR|nr:major facilitator superfamily domain-containing protein [Mycena metata]